MPDTMKKRDIKLCLESLIILGEDVPSGHTIEFGGTIEQDLMDLRTLVAYMKFDIEALRRERDYWLKKALHG